MESCSTHIITELPTFRNYWYNEISSLMLILICWHKIIPHHCSHSAIVYGPIFFSFKLKDLWKVTPITLSFRTPKTFRNTSYTAGWHSWSVTNWWMHKRSAAGHLIFFFKIILASWNFTPFRHICHPKLSGQAYITFSFISSSIWNADSQTYLSKDTATDHLIKSNTILILSYPFLLRQFIYKTIFALSNSIF